MKNSEVFIAKCSHYTPSPLEVEDLLDDVGLKPDDDCVDKRVVVKAVLGYLSEKRSLKSESEASTSQSYDVEGLENHMLALCNQYGFDPSEYLPGSMTVVEDYSDMW